MSNLDTASNLVERLERSYVKWPSSFGPCFNEECNNSARGCGLCSDCLEAQLSEIIGANIASQLHSAIKLQNEIWGVIKDNLDAKDNQHSERAE